MIIIMTIEVVMIGMIVEGKFYLVFDILYKKFIMYKKYNTFFIFPSYFLLLLFIYYGDSSFKATQVTARECPI